MASDSGWGNLAAGILAVTTMITAARVSVSDWQHLRGCSSGASGNFSDSCQFRTAETCIFQTSVSDSIAAVALRESGQRQPVIQRLKIAAASLMVLQSLDSSGTRHTFRLRTSSCRGDADSVGRVSSAGGISDHRRLRLAIFSERSRVAGPGVVTGCASDLCGEKLEARAPSRRVLLPLFTDIGIREVVVECRCIYRGESVTVYAGPDAIQSGDLSPENSDLLCFFLDRHLQTDNGTLRTLIESCLGPIADVDGDGHLAVVLTNLDRRTQSSSDVGGRIPVLGCVREADFLDGSGDEGGDILYLSPQGLLAEDGRSLLAHELAHAAVHSRQRERLLMGRPKLDLPGWFHESLAHVAEHTAAGLGELFRERLREFQMRPQCSPIVLPVSTSWSEGRGGSRAAGLLFLHHSLRPSADVAELLRATASFEELLEDVLGRSFAESLADWGPAAAEQILLTGGETVPKLSVGEELEGELAGTALQCWRTDSESLTIEIESAFEAALRISVVPIRVENCVTAGN